MFGGQGIYAGDLMFALEVGGEIFLKVDDGSRAAFEAAGSRPFVYGEEGRSRRATGACPTARSTTPPRRPAGPGSPSTPPGESRRDAAAPGGEGCPPLSFRGAAGEPGTIAADDAGEGATPVASIRTRQRLWVPDSRCA
ncbi:MAG TPA: TfoX/Sxy family protein, partial [Microvirga sp.]|nr:TfoX/Sxy family protein [Microvirga sp.]